MDLSDSKNITEILQTNYKDQNVVFIKTDVTKKEQVKSAFDEVISKFKFVDIVVANAGILREKDYELTFNVNVVRILMELVSCTVFISLEIIDSLVFFTQLTLLSIL